MVFHAIVLPLEAAKSESNDIDRIFSSIAFILYGDMNWNLIDERKMSNARPASVLKEEKVSSTAERGRHAVLSRLSSGCWLNAAGRQATSGAKSLQHLFRHLSYPIGHWPEPNP